MAKIVALDQPGMTAPPSSPEPEVDYFNRYKIPDPITGEMRTWTRATTWAKTVADTYNLTKWELRMTALGLSKRPDLQAGVLGVLDPDSKEGKKKIDALVEKAKEYARSSERSTMGTALHSWAEAHDTGRKVEYIPPAGVADLAAYKRAMRGVKVSQNYVEKVGVIQGLGVAGKMDRVVAFYHSKLPMVGDLKTGKDLDFSWTEISIQLALYSRSDTIYDPATKQHRPMLEVDKEKALVIHLPAGEARCDLYILNIAAGWEMASEICTKVRAWRSRKDLHQLLVSEEAK